MIQRGLWERWRGRQIDGCHGDEVWGLPIETHGSQPPVKRDFIHQTFCLIFPCPSFFSIQVTGDMEVITSNYLKLQSCSLPSECVYQNKVEALTCIELIEFERLFTPVNS